MAGVEMSATAMIKKRIFFIIIFSLTSLTVKSQNLTLSKPHCEATAGIYARLSVSSPPFLPQGQGVPFSTLTFMQKRPCCICGLPGRHENPVGNPINSLFPKRDEAPQTRLFLSRSSEPLEPRDLKNASYWVDRDARKQDPTEWKFG